MTRQRIAAVLQVAGLLAISVAVGSIVVWAGVLTLGVGLVLFGVALERETT